MNMVASAFSARPFGVRTCNRKAIAVTAPFDRASVKARVASVKDDVENSVASALVEEEEPVFEDAYEIATLSVDQVNDLIKTVSEETSIAEVHLKLADLEVKFRRSAGNVPAAAAAPPPPPPVQPAPVPVAPSPVAVSLESIDDYDMMSESTISVHSPKVGSMCVHKYVKGNRVGRDPIVKVGDKVKKGQVIAYIAQLGTHWPVEAPMSGEIVEIVVADGDVVEYDQEIARIVPFFGGHIIGDSKLK